MAVREESGLPSAKMCLVNAEEPLRRTRLANERTYLAWWRSGLTAVAVGLGAGRVAPSLTSGSEWPYEVIGVGYAILGVAFVAYAYRRHQEVEEALREGNYAPFQSRVALLFSFAGLVLGLGTVLLILFAR
jgi:putative membrane protein